MVLLSYRSLLTKETSTVKIKLICFLIFYISIFCSSVYAQKFVVYGDTRNQSSIPNHTELLTELAKENPDIILHVGDMANEFNEVNRDFFPVISGKFYYESTLGCKQISFRLGRFVT